MTLYLILAPSRTLIVPDEEESGVSGPIRSIKMSSCIQCAMQEKSVCCRDIPCLAYVEQEPDPLHPGTRPLSYLPGHWRLSLLVALNKDGSGQCSGHSRTAQPGNSGP
jgi:hypothetical protein